MPQHLGGDGKVLKIEALVLFEDRSIPIAFGMSIYDEGMISSDRSTMDQVYRKIEGWPYIWYQTKGFSVKGKMHKRAPIG